MITLSKLFSLETVDSIPWFISRDKSLLKLQREEGFTLIELIITTSMISILTALSWGAFWIYKDNSEYARAEVTYRNARTALEVGEQELPDGAAIAFQYTATTGGNVLPPLADFVPGASVPDDVRLGVMYRDCGGMANMALNSLLVAEPCQATKQVRWMRFCNGIEVLMPKIPQPKGCP